MLSHSLRVGRLLQKELEALVFHPISPGSVQRTVEENEKNILTYAEDLISNLQRIKLAVENQDQFVPSLNADALAHIIALIETRRVLVSMGT